jgi:hypothetical protein
MNGSLACSVEAATDSDTLSDCNGSRPSPDTVTYTWSASGGGFRVGTNADGTPRIAPTASGANATYVPAKDFAGRVTISCTLRDVAAMSAGQGGNRNDPPVTRSCVVMVKGDAVHITYVSPDLMEANGRDHASIMVLATTTARRRRG